MADFEVQPLSGNRIRSMKTRTEWTAHCPVGLERLVEVRFKHHDFYENVLNGQMIVLDELGEAVLEIFRELYDASFPIEKAVPVDDFDGNDVASMEANNSSAFNPRMVMNTDRWSSHAYGCAIDINPRQNPYMPDPLNHPEKIYPSGGESFVSRSILKKGMVETIVPIFAKHGFNDWGGSWQTPLDYHHFQLKWDRIKQLV